MKNKLLIAVLLTLCILPIGISAHESGGNHLFAGLRFDDGVKISVGVDKIVSGNIHALAYTNVGDYSSVSTELAAIFSFSGGFYGGVLAGPNVDFGNVATESPLTYITGASGFLIGVDASRWGAVGYTKYKFKVDDASTYIDGWEAGAMLTYGF